MESFVAKVKDPVGFHARPASIIVNVASRFNAEISIKVRDRKGNLKSIMNIMALGIKTGEEFTIEANGVDEKAAIAEIEKTMKTNTLI